MIKVGLQNGLDDFNLRMAKKMHCRCGVMTEDEYKQLKATIDPITEQEKSLRAHAQDAEDPFTPGYERNL